MSSGGKNEIIIYHSGDGKIKVDVTMLGGTFWLPQAQIAQLFERSVSTISRYIKNIFEEGELELESNLQNMQIAFSDKPVVFYSLEVVIAVGYRVKSQRGTQFRQWATQILHEYMQKGFSLNDELLKNMGGGLYWKELLDRIRDDSGKREED
ncbi:MAG: RhuM family protein [Planctomycetia bacterium]|nr:RhuM family protein [Planctomycetia bacterium]